MATLTEKGEELILMLKKVEDKEDCMSTMLALTVEQKNPDENYQKMIDFLIKNPTPTEEEITHEVGNIIGIDWGDE